MNSRLPPQLAAGDEAIDGQHRALLALIDETVAAVRADDAARARAAIARLGDDLMAHFAAEESSMAATQYPERGRHKAAHDLFMQDYVALVRQLEQAGLSVPLVEAFTARVPEWFKFHVQVNDVPLGRWLAAKRSRTAAAHPDAKPRAS